MSWYAHIAEASNELLSELRKMDQAKATPMQFGLAVRSHPSALMVTARNKIGAGQKTVQIGLASNFVETARLSAKGDDLDSNRNAAKTLISNLVESGYSPDSSDNVSGGYLLRSVPVEYIDRFLLSWINAEVSITTQIEPMRKYIRDRIADELSVWDVHISSKKAGKEDLSLGWPIIPIERSIGDKDLKKGFVSIGGSNMRVSSPDVERLGLNENVAQSVESEFRSRPEFVPKHGKQIRYPGYIYRNVRERPLLALYLVSIKKPDDPNKPIHPDFPIQPVVAWAISFPRSAKADQKVEYIINTTKQKELFGEPDQDEDEAHAYD